jgi:putative ABC transport system substrate-binding protein
MKRRQFITLLGGTVAWPPTARAQQAAMPVVGFLHPASFHAAGDQLRAFHQGLKEAGFVDGENVVIEYRWADNRTDRLPALAADLVRRRVAVIATVGTSAFAAKAATTTIPIVFVGGEDPVKLGLVASLARPGGNLTGINWLGGELAAKRLELLRQLVPAATRAAVLVNPAFATLTEITLRDVEAAARAMGLQIQVLNADTSREIDAAFEIIGREQPDALIVGPGPFFNSRRVQMAQLAARYAVPAIHTTRLEAEAGGLMSYGPSITDAYRQVGAYTGRILKGAKPEDLPIVQSSKHQRSDCPDATPHRAGNSTRPRRRGDRMSARLKRRAFITLLDGAAA